MVGKNRMFAGSALAALTLVLSACSETADQASTPEGPIVDRPPEDPGDLLCDLTGTYEAENDCARFNEQFEGLEAGVDAFDPSESMVADKPTIVRYAITRLPESIQGEGGEIAEAVPEPAEITRGHDERPETDGPLAVEIGRGNDPEPVVGTPITATPQPSPTPPPLPTPTGPTQAEIDAALAEAGGRVSRIVGRDADSDDVEVGTIKIGRLMYACLTADPTFKVEPQECQTVNTIENPDADWRWSVTPTEPGEAYELTLRSGIVVKASDGTLRRIGQPSRSAEIDVTVTALGKFQRFLSQVQEWVLSPVGLLGALATLLFAIGRLRKAWRAAREGTDGEDAKQSAPAGLDPTSEKDSAETDGTGS